MFRNFAWKAFERTGNINAYMMYREADKINNEGDKTVEDSVKGIVEGFAQCIGKEIAKEGEEMVISS